MSASTAPRTHKARKRHRCDWCNENIEPGEQYTRYRWFDGGDAFTVKLHPECYDALGELDYVDEWAPGENPRGAVATE